MLYNITYVLSNITYHVLYNPNPNPKITYHVLYNITYDVLPYKFTYKAYLVIRRTLNFRRRLWQVSKIKISPKYPVIRRTQNYGKILLTTFAVLTTICFQKLLITVLSLSTQKRKSHTLQTIAKKSDIDNNSPAKSWTWTKPRSVIT